MRVPLPDHIMAMPIDELHGEGALGRESLLAVVPHEHLVTPRLLLPDGVRWDLRREGRVDGCDADPAVGRHLQRVPSRGLSRPTTPCVLSHGAGEVLRLCIMALCLATLSCLAPASRMAGWLSVISLPPVSLVCISCRASRLATGASPP